MIDLLSAPMCMQSFVALLCVLRKPYEAFLDPLRTDNNKTKKKNN